MIHLLADVPANSGNWMDNLQFFFTLILGAAGVWAVVSNRTQRREVSFSEEFARKEDLQRIESDVDQLRTKMDGMQHTLGGLSVELNHAGEQRAREIHVRIDQVLTAVAELRGQLRQMNKDGEC